MVTPVFFQIITSAQNIHAYHYIKYVGRCIWCQPLKLTVLLLSLYCYPALISDDENNNIMLYEYYEQLQFIKIIIVIILWSNDVPAWYTSVMLQYNTLRRIVIILYYELNIMPVVFIMFERHVRYVYNLRRDLWTLNGLCCILVFIFRAQLLIT